MNIILDACAVIAFFRNETGADLVREKISHPDNNSMIHIVNLCEVYYDFYRDIVESETEKLIKELSDINVRTRFDLTANFWRQVSKYKATIKRISLADCFALTLADQEKGILVTSDRKEFEPIVPLNICQIDFIR
ncbi:MAG: type II toxin-antitoxin system VapC family toxin [Dolichospermum sp.]